MGTCNQIWPLPCALNPSMAGTTQGCGKYFTVIVNSYLILGGDGENHFVGSRPERKLLLKKQHRCTHESNYCIVRELFEEFNFHSFTNSI